MTNKHRGPLNAPQTDETDAQFKARHKLELTIDLQE
jgi:hypothetical protein